MKLATSRGNSLRNVFKRCDEYTKVEKCYHDALEIHKETGNKEERSNKLSKLGALYQSVSKYAEAQQCLLEALKISQETGDKFSEATSYLNLGTGLESPVLVNSLNSKEHYQKQKQKNSLTKHFTGRKETGAGRWRSNR